MSVIAGAIVDYPAPEDAPDYKGTVVIEWPYSSSPPAVNQVLPSVLTSVRDGETDALIPAAKITVHADVPGLITADIAVFLDRQGEIIHDPNAICRDAVGVPATFTFLVRAMRNGSDPL